MAAPIAAAGLLATGKAFLGALGGKLFATKLSTAATTFFGSKLLGL